MDREATLRGSSSLEREKLMCGMKFYLKGTLRNHIASHMQGRPYACEFCPKAFSTLHGRLTHTKLHLGQKDFQCPHCPKTFVAKAGMQDHSNIHTGLRPYKCLVCERSFPSRQTRRCHMASHSLTKDYVCHICNERFQHPNTLSSHKRKKHNATKCTRVEPVILTKPNVAPTHSEHTLNR